MSFLTIREKAMTRSAHREAAGYFEHALGALSPYGQKTRTWLDSSVYDAAMA